MKTSWKIFEQGEANEYALLVDHKRWVVSLRLNGEFRLGEQISIIKLISASPELLESLKEIVALISEKDTAFNEAIEKAKAAIEKATK